MTMQALGIAHAAYGHNSFFKGNYLFRTWTAPDAIVDYLVFARNFIADCEEKYGVDEVEQLLEVAGAADLQPRVDVELPARWGSCDLLRARLVRALAGAGLDFTHINWCRAQRGAS